MSKIKYTDGRIVRPGDHSEHLGHHGEEPPCFCQRPMVTLIRRGWDIDCLYWVQCLMCERQFPPAMTMPRAVQNYERAMTEGKDPLNDNGDT